MKLRERFTRRLFDKPGPAVGFRIDEIRLPNGKTALRQYLDHPGAVAVIPLIAPDKVVMVRQFRYPVNCVTLEIPAGKLDKNEQPLLCVKRELEEETGMKAGRVRKLLSFWPTATFANEIIHVYVADKLKPGNAHPDEDEFLATEIWPLKKLYAEIDAGRVQDAKTLIALQALRQSRAKKQRFLPL
jgi:ADP-ribose pyrophosphatase